MIGKWMEQEIWEQSGCLAQNCSSYFESAKFALSGQKPQMILLVARGSSDNAALYARYLIEIHLRIPVSMAAPSVVTKYATSINYPDCLAIGISQSGAAPDVAEVIQRMKSDGHRTLAITNTSNSLLTQSADSTVLLNVGKETSVAATKTFTSTLLALYQIVRALGAELPDPSANLPTEDWMKATRDQAEAEHGHLNRFSPAFCLSRGYGFSVAQESALKLMECALIPAKSYSTADFEHGPKALAGPSSVAVIYGEHGDGLKRQGCQIINAPCAKTCPELAPISEVIFGQWLALFAARSRNLDPDNPSFIQKVTETL